jgi:hypothetical protein
VTLLVTVQPDVAALVALADGLQLHQPGQRGGVVLQQAGEFGVAVELVEAGNGNGGGHVRPAAGDEAGHCVAPPRAAG